MDNLLILLAYFIGLLVLLLAAHGLAWVFGWEE